MTQESSMMTGIHRKEKPVAKSSGIILIIASIAINGLMVGLVGMKAQQVNLYLAGYIIGTLFGQFAMVTVAYVAGEVWAKKKKTIRPGYLYMGFFMLVMAIISFMMQYQRWS